jgi:hypothetical protein
MSRRILHTFVAAVTLCAVVGPLASSTSAGGREWILINSDCKSGGVSGWSKYTRCWAKKQRNRDRDRRLDYYTFRMTISGNATDGKYMSKLWVEPNPGSRSPRMRWAGADPFQPDETVTTENNDCTTTTWSIGITVARAVTASFSSSTQQCDKEHFGPKLYSEQGHHAGIWWAEEGNRAPAGVVKKAVAMVAVRTRQGKQPNWSTDRYGANTHYDQDS